MPEGSNFHNDHYEMSHVIYSLISSVVPCSVYNEGIDEGDEDDE